VRRDALQIALHRSIGPDDAYFKVIRDGWSDSLRNAFHALPDRPSREAGAGAALRKYRKWDMRLCGVHVSA